LPAELQFREQRLAKIQEAKARLEEQARAAAEQQRQPWAAAEAERLAQGKKPREPQAFADTPADKAQTNFTDPELKIMPQANQSWEYGGNAPVVVDDVCQIIVACDVVLQSNDKQQALPMAQQALANLEAVGIDRPVDTAGQPQKILSLADSGYFSAEAVSGLEELGLDAYIATERQRHHAPAAGAATGPSGAAAMRAKLATARGRAVYGLRKGIVEPVFGQIKGARGFRRFSLRGLAQVRAEWRLVCLTHNLLKLWRYHCAPSCN
jgi:hypothetical protein